MLVEKNLNNAEVARRSNLSATYIGNLIRDFSPNTKSGLGRPSRETARAIALALGVEPNDALRAAGYTPDSDSGTIKIDIDKDVELVLHRKDIRPEDLEEYEQAVSLAVAMAEKRIANRRGEAE